MCVYLASHGLIASRPAIYKQASLKNNEHVKSINASADEVTGGWPGAAGGGGWGRGYGREVCRFALLRMDGECRMPPPPPPGPGHTGRTEQTCARSQLVLWPQRVGLLLICSAVSPVQASMDWHGRLVTSAGSAQAEAFFSALPCGTPAPRIGKVPRDARKA